MRAVEFTSFVGAGMNWFTWCFGIFSLALAGIIYLVKAIKYWDVVKMEWNHPTRCYFDIVPVDASLMLILGTPKEAWDLTTGKVVMMIFLFLQI